jgi:nucleotidyltransferase AbiEii toxin of type IV toxin-antitoxin system
MSIALLERAASALGPLLDEVVFVGGATITLWITDPGAPAPRPTKDVDVVVEVTTRADLELFDQRLRERGFREDIDSGVTCRWRHDRPCAAAPEDAAAGEDDLILDAMPARAALLGFENRWQAAALPYAAQTTLPSGHVIRAVPPPYLLATKLEAFHGRGQGDYLASRDLDDVVSLIDGREELTAEVAAARDDLRNYLAREIGDLVTDAQFIDAVLGFLRPDMASQARAVEVVLPALRDIASND